MGIGEGGDLVILFCEGGINGVTRQSSFSKTVDLPMNLTHFSFGLTLLTFSIKCYAEVKRTQISQIIECSTMGIYVSII